MEVPLTPVRLLDRAVSIYGDKVGVVCGEHRLTYGEFGQRAGRLAAALDGLGVPAGGVVGYLGLNCHRLLEAYYGVVGAGRILLPMNVRLSPEELAFIFDDAELSALLVGPELVPLAQAVLGQCRARPVLVYCGDGAAPAQLGAAAYEDLLANAAPVPLRRPDDDGTVAEIFYTSGTTGRPKGVMLTHRNLYLHALMALSVLNADDSHVVLHTLPLFHVNGWGTPHHATVVGATHVVLPRFDPAQVLAMIEAERVTHMNLVPAMAIALVNHPDRTRRRVDSVQRIVIGGAPAATQLIADVEAAFGGLVTGGYGLSETSPLLTVSAVKGYRRAALGEAGRLQAQAAAGLPAPGVDLRVVDDQMRDVPRDGESRGEIVVQSDVVMKGYWKRPQETAEAFAGGWFHTGDVATWDADGYVHIVDRKKDVIISGGENISSVEVENALYAHPAVMECAVVSKPDAQWGEVPFAFVTLRPGASATAEELIEHVRGRLAHFKAPKGVEFAAELPKTGTGKIQKTGLRERLWAGHDRRVG